MADRTCSIEGCGKPPRSRTAEWCPMHYHRWYRHGHPLRLATRSGPQEDLRGQRFGALVVTAWAPSGDKSMWACVCDCGATKVVTTGSLNRYGSSNTCGDKSAHLRDDITYSGAHERVRSLRGSASRHQCVDCGRKAGHWSYDHGDIQELYTAEGLPYSLHPAHYEARCVPCHKRFDLGRAHHTTV